MPEQVFETVEGRDGIYQFTGFMRFNLKHNSPKTGLIGVLPYEAVIISIKAYVKTAFSSTKLGIGSTAGGKEYGEKEIKTISVQDFTPTDAKCFVASDKETRLFYNMDSVSNAGDGVIIVQFVPKR